MELEIYDENLERLGIVDEFMSLIWTRRFYDTGVFELRAPITENNIKLLQKSRYIYRADADETSFIKSIGEFEQEGEKFITVSGAMLEGILDKRTISKDGYDTILKNTIHNQIADGTVYGFYNMRVNEDTYGIVNEGSDIEAVGRNLGEYSRELLTGYKRAVKIDFFPAEKNMICSFVSGIDRSKDIIFSSENLNIYNTEYNYSEEGCYNLVEAEAVYPEYIGIQHVVTNPEKEWMLKVFIGDKSNRNLNLTNLFVLIDATIGEQDDFWTDENHEIHHTTLKVLNYEDTYERLLTVCRQYYKPFTENFSGTAIGDGYRKEWNVGDYVTFRDDNRETSYVKQIEEVTEAFEVGGKRVDIVLGAALKTIFDLIREAKLK